MIKKMDQERRKQIDEELKQDPEKGINVLSQITGMKQEKIKKESERYNKILDVCKQARKEVLELYNDEPDRLLKGIETFVDSFTYGLSEPVLKHMFITILQYKKRDKEFDDQIDKLMK